MEHLNVRADRTQADDAPSAARAAKPSRAPTTAIRRQLRVGAANDPLERDADRIADAVMSTLHAPGRAGVPFDGRAGAGRIRPSSTIARTDVIRRVPSDYKSDVDIKAMTLRDFDAHAHAQADWATSAALGASKDPLRALLARARANKSRLLNGCGEFDVDELLGLAARYDDLDWYAQAASSATWAGTVHITKTASNAGEAAEWGKALHELHQGVGGLRIERVIPQRAGLRGDGLKSLVDANAVTDFVTYYKAVQPVLDASNGAEVDSYLAFRGAGGQAKYGGYQTSLPEIHNYHRFTVAQLDQLVKNKAAAATNATKDAPLPIAVVLQSAFDHNGAFHQDPYMTVVIARTNVITVVSEGHENLSTFSTHLSKFAAWGKDGKVDEVLVSGHGNAKLMELAGRREVLKYDDGTRSYDEWQSERVVVDKTWSAGARAKTDTFFDSIKAVLRDDPSARVVLNACLTASNSVSTTLDANPDVAAGQVTTAIATDPSLATTVQTRLGAHQAKVLGANASFAQVGLLDPQERLDIVSKGDQHLTADKLTYAEGGTEPLGALRATLEAWSKGRGATVDALRRRLAAKNDRSWKETVIRALYRVIVANPDDGELIRKLADAAGALGHLTSPAECTVSGLDGKVPPAHVDAVFTDLATWSLWSNAQVAYVPLVVHQVWSLHDAAKTGALLAFLDGSTYDTRTATPYLDVGVLAPRLNELLALPPTSPPPRGAFLIALAHFTRRQAPPKRAIDYIKAVVGTNKAFPPTSGVAGLLKGKTEQDVLVASGVLPKAADTTSNAETAATPNVAPTGAQHNTVAVDSLTRKGVTKGGWFSTDAYALPSGEKVGTIPHDTTLDVIGITKGTVKGLIWDDANVRFYAVERAMGMYRTVFVRTTDLELV